ncbi:MAG: hypothetical protein K2L67_01660 [Clostridia bacterium]|nr:hypothetical protein [Clostridia bacterium]
MSENNGRKPAKRIAEAAKKATQRVNKTVAARQKKTAANTVTSNRLKLLITVVGRNKAEYFLDLIQSFEVNMQIVALAQGTADAKTLSFLGLTDTDKCVIFSVIQESKLSDAMHVLGEKFKTIKDGKGIAFTVPLTSVIGTLIFGFLSNNKTVVKEAK